MKLFAIYNPDPDTRIIVIEAEEAPKDGRNWIEITKNDIVTYTAEEWLNLQGIGANRQPTLLYLRQSLTSESKESPLLNSLESYLRLVLSMYATDPKPRKDWPLAPTTFDAAVQEAVSLLSS